MTGTHKRDFLTGLVMLLSLAGLVVTLWLFGDLRNVFESYYSFTLRLNEAGGLSSTSPVSLNGLRIGSIVEAKVHEDPAQGVVLTLRVKKDQRIPEDFTVSIDKSFVGETTLSLDVPKRAPGSPASAFVQPGGTYDRIAKTLYTMISEQVKEPLEKVGGMAEDFHRLADVYEKVGQSVADLFEPRTPAQVEGGAAPNASSAIARLDSMLADAKKWLGDDGARADFAMMLSRGSSAAGKLDDTLDAFKKSATEATNSIAAVSAKIGVTTDEANAALRRIGEAADQVGQIATGINKGEGTLGQLARNPDLYENARDAAARLEKAMAEFQLLLEKYRSEGLKLQF